VGPACCGLLGARHLRGQVRALVLVGVGQLPHQPLQQFTQHLVLLLFEQLKLEAEHHEVREQAVHVSVQVQRDQLLVVGMVYVRDDVQQVLVDLPNRRFKCRRERVTCKAVNTM